jgi:Tol biopolymer transport system component
MIRRDGYVKVLDFGLVKLTELRDHNADRQSQVSLSTQSGAVLGTVNYMSPEQALGQEIDQRTDIFSLGVVLYEMITGQSPFKGTTVASTFDAILNKQPPSISSSNPNVSIELERIINRALEKDREVRYQTAADLRAVLRRLQKNIDSGITASAEAIAAANSPKAKGRVSHWWMKLAIAVGFLALLSVAVWWFAPRNHNRSDGVDWSLATVVKITDQAGAELFPSLSPDGKSLIYTSRISGNYEIYYKRIGTKKTTNLTEDPADDSQPAFSPDGTRIAFRSSRKGGGIFVMTETGESVRQCTDFGFNPAWSPDGKEIVCTENSVEGNNRTHLSSRMWIVGATTGDYRLLYEGDAVQASWSPNGKRIAFWGVPKGGTQRDIWTISSNGGEPVAVTQDAFIDINPLWSPDGKSLYFVSNRKGAFSLWRVAIDEASGKPLAEPELVPLPSAGSRHISISRDGKRLAFAQVNNDQNAYKLSFDPVAETISGQPMAVTHSSTSINSPVISPDGSLLAYTMTGFQVEIYILKIGNPVADQITENTGNNAIPRWSPDGKKLAFYSNPSGVYEIFSINSDGSGRQQLTAVGSPGAVYGLWSPVDTRMAYSMFGGKTFLVDLSKPLKEQTPEETPLFANSKDHFVAWDWSPDGKYLAGSRSSLDESKRGIHIYSLETHQFEQLSNFGERVIWLNDSRRLLFTNDNKLYLVDRLTKQPKELFAFLPNTISAPSITKDNRSIYLAIASSQADIWLLTLD